MGTWRNSKLITLCPICGAGKLQLAREPGKRLTKAERVYFCPRCKEAFIHEELVIHWPKANMHVRLYPCDPQEALNGGMEIIGDISEIV